MKQYKSISKSPYSGSIDPGQHHSSPHSGRIGLLGNILQQVRVLQLHQGQHLFGLVLDSLIFSFQQTETKRQALLFEVGVDRFEIQRDQLDALVLDVFDYGESMSSSLTHVQQSAVLLWEFIAQVEQLDQHSQHIAEIEIERLHLLQPIKFLLAKLTLIDKVQIGLRCDFQFDIRVRIKRRRSHDPHIEHITNTVLFALGIGLPDFEWTLTMEGNFEGPALQHGIKIADQVFFAVGFRHAQLALLLHRCVHLPQVEFLYWDLLLLWLLGQRDQNIRSEND